MKSTKKLCALTAAVLIAANVTACGKSSGKKSDDDSFVPTENVKVESTDKIDRIPEGAETELIYMGLADINPTKANKEKSTELTLFEDLGGSIAFKQTTYFGQYDELAAAIMSNQDIPDFVDYNWLSFPCHTLKGMNQPIDDIVDFDDPLWADVKDDAEQYSLSGKHYVAPLNYEASAMMCYDHAIIESEGLDDPYELYLEGEWTQDNWASIMREYVANDPDGGRFGINGFFKQHCIQQTGKILVNYDTENNTFSSNLKDPDIEAVQNLLYDLNKDGIFNNEWIGSAREAFTAGCLFYSMGAWGYAANNGPKEDDDWRVVPIPTYKNDQQKITTSDMTAYMWVKGSTKNEAMKCWLECCRLTYTDPDYKETNRLKYMENNPYWTDEMYDVMMDVTSDDYYMIYDYCYGLSNNTGDPNAFDGNISLTDVLYKMSSQQDSDGNQNTWAQIREMYSGTIDTEIDEVNREIKKLSD
ncbi:MAG: extracellular solute-binding protein [Oscillospiraceae bacterium]